MNTHPNTPQQFPSFNAYCLAVMPKLDWPQHIEIIAEQVEGIVAGRVTRSQVNTPPQHGSTTFALLALAYAIGIAPEKRYACASRRAHTQARELRYLLKGAVHSAIFPRSTPVAELSASAHTIEMTAGGSVAFGSIERGLQGPYDGIVVDDPFGDFQGHCDAHTRAAFEKFFEDVAVLSGAGFIHISDARLPTTWRPDQGPWARLDFAAVSNAGMALWPARKSRELLMNSKAALPADCWELLFQQNVDGYNQVG